MILAVQPLGRKMRILADRFIYPYLATSQTDPPPLIRPYAAGFRIRMKILYAYKVTAVEWPQSLTTPGLVRPSLLAFCAFR
jgi:hypothetical protein